MLPVVMPSRLLAIAAGLHRAPAAAAVAAVIQEEPIAIRSLAFANFLQVRRGQQLRRRLRDRPDDSLQITVIVPLPAVAAVLTNNTPMPQRIARCLADQLDVRGGRWFAIRQRQERTEDGFPQYDGRSHRMQTAARSGPRVASERLSLIRGEDAALPRERDQITIARHMIDRLFSRIPAADAVGEIKRKMAAGEVKLEFLRTLAGGHPVEIVTNLAENSG